MRARPRQLLLGGISLMVLVIVAFALVIGNLARTPALYSGLKPTAALTPVPGNAQTPVAHADGHYESLVTASGVTYVGSDGGGVFALREADGTLLWRHDLPGYVTLYAVSNGLLYAVAPPASSVYALHAESGAVAWQRALDIDVLSLAVAGGAVFAGGNTQTGGNAAINAFGAEDGAPLWSYSAAVAMPRSLVVADGIVYAHPFPDHTPVAAGPSLLALRASDGQVLWSRATQEGTDYAGPVVADGVTYIVTETVAGLQISGIEVDALASASGKLLWRYTTAGDGIGGETLPVLVDGTLYVGAVNNIYALRSTDGTPIWRAAKAETTSPPESPLLVGDGGVYYTGGLGSIYALRVGDGTRLWSKHVNNSVIGMTEEHGRLDVMTQLNLAYALSAGDGSLLWQQPIDHFNSWQLDSPPYTIADAIVTVGTDKGRVEAIRASDGMVLWHYDIAPKPVLPDPVYTAAVTFDSSVAYAQALRAVIDLGLQTFGSICQPDWGPQGDASPWNHQLLVASTPLAPPGWLDPLGKIAGVTKVQPTPVFNCPAIIITPGAGPPPPPVQPGIYVIVSFAAGTDYDTALALVDDLGFRLGNPCYENKPAGTQVQWTPMGQEQSFATTHRLLVVTTGANSTAWQQQLQSAPGVSGVNAGITPACGATP
jgi:outer membrane protein assembly factor BamB